MEPSSVNLYRTDWHVSEMSMGKSRGLAMAARHYFRKLDPDFWLQVALTTSFRKDPFTKTFTNI